MTTTTDQIDVAVAVELRCDRGIADDVVAALQHALGAIAHGMGVEVLGQIEGTDDLHTVHIYGQSRGDDVDKFVLDERLVPDNRCRNLLHRNEISTVGDLCSWSEKELLRLDRLGRPQLAELKAMLRTINRELRPDTV